MNDITNCLFKLVDFAMFNNVRIEVWDDFVNLYRYESIDGRPFGFRRMFSCSTIEAVGFKTIMDIFNEQYEKEKKKFTEEFNYG